MNVALQWGKGVVVRLWSWIRSIGLAIGSFFIRQAQEVMRHPLRTLWALIPTVVTVLAVWPLPDYVRGFWLHCETWFLANEQHDYGEGPLFNQQVILYHLLFSPKGYRGDNIYSFDNAPPFIVGNYPPVFALVGAIFMRFVGQTFEAGRLVSSLAIIGTCVMIALIVLQATKQILPAIFAGGLLVTFTGIFQWGPYNRVDSLALFWSVCTVFLVLRYAGTRKVWWALPFAVLTIYTRQSLVDGIFASYCYLLVRDWRRGLAVGVATGVAILGIFMGLQIWSHGAFFLNAVIDNDNALSWPTVLSNWHSFMTNQGGHFVYGLAAAGAVAGMFGPGGIMWPLWMLGSAFIFATIGKTGAAINYFFPLYAFSCASAGVFVGRFRTFFRRSPFFLWPLELLVPLMLFVFIHGTVPQWAKDVPLSSRVIALVGEPTANDSQSARNDKAKYSPSWKFTGTPQLIAYLKTVRGPVLSPGFPYGVAVQAGHALEWQPFELGVSYDDGTWNPQPFLASINDRYYTVVFGSGNALSFPGALGPYTFQLDQAVRANYHYSRTIDGYQIYVRDRPAIPLPPPPPVTVPRPLHDLPGVVWRIVRAVPKTVLRMMHQVVPPVPIRVGNFEEVGLGNRLNRIGVAQPGVPAASDEGVDGLGDFLSTASFPKPGTLRIDSDGQFVPFLIPLAGSKRKSVLALDGSVTLQLPSGEDEDLWLLATGVNGPQHLHLTMHSQGESTEETIVLPDWCVPGSTPYKPAYQETSRVNAQGQVIAPDCGVYVVPIPIRPARMLNSVTLGRDPNVIVVSVTVEQAR